MLNGYEKWGAIYSSKAMVLASHGENFFFIVGRVAFLFKASFDYK